MSAGAIASAILLDPGSAMAANPVGPACLGCVTGRFTTNSLAAANLEPGQWDAAASLGVVTGADEISLLPTAQVRVGILDRAELGDTAS